MDPNEAKAQFVDVVRNKESTAVVAPVPPGDIRIVTWNLNEAHGPFGTDLKTTDVQDRLNKITNLLGKTLKSSILALQEVYDNPPDLPAPYDRRGFHYSYQTFKFGNQLCSLMQPEDTKAATGTVFSLHDAAALKAVEPQGSAAQTNLTKPSTENRIAIIRTFQLPPQCGPGRLIVCCTHLDHQHSDGRMLEIRALHEHFLIKQMKVSADDVVVIAGDFNEIDPSTSSDAQKQVREKYLGAAAFKQVIVDGHNPCDYLRRQGYEHILDSVADKKKRYKFTHWTLTSVDHMFVLQSKPILRVHRVQVVWTPESDHLPVVADLGFICNQVEKFYAEAKRTLTLDTTTVQTVLGIVHATWSIQTARQRLPPLLSAAKVDEQTSWPWERLDKKRNTSEFPISAALRAFCESYRGDPKDAWDKQVLPRLQSDLVRTLLLYRVIWPLLSWAETDPFVTPALLARCAILATRQVATEVLRDTVEEDVQLAAAVQSEMQKAAQAAKPGQNEYKPDVGKAVFLDGENPVPDRPGDRVIRRVYIPILGVEDIHQGFRKWLSHVLTADPKTKPPSMYFAFLSEVARRKDLVTAGFAALYKLSGRRQNWELDSALVMQNSERERVQVVNLRLQAVIASALPVGITSQAMQNWFAGNVLLREALVSDAEWQEMAHYPFAFATYLEPAVTDGPTRKLKWPSVWKDELAQRQALPIPY